MSNTIITERGKVLWVQCVASKSGGEAHMVRCFEGGIITCDCDGFNWRGKCSHQAQGKAQEAREALAAASLPVAPATAPLATNKASRGASAYFDLYGEEWRAA